MYSRSTREALQLPGNSTTPTSSEALGTNHTLAISNGRLETPANKLSRSLVRKAKRFDRELRERFASMEADVIRIGQLLLEIRDKRLYLALGYKNLQCYVQDALGYGKSQAYEAMRIFRELTSGHQALPTAAVSRMTRENAKRVIRLKKCGICITPQIVEAAQNLPEGQFEEQVEYPALKGKGIAVLVRHTLVLPKEILDRLLNAHENLKHRVTDANPTRLSEKAWELAVEILEKELARQPKVDTAPKAVGAALSIVTDTRRRC